MIRALLALLIVAAPAVAATPDAAAIAPTGTLRAALNFGNPVLAQRDPAGGEPHGVSAELARALAERLGVPLRIVAYNEAGDVAAAAAQDKWDVAFLAIDPVRAATIDYTAPYVLIEGVYAVTADSPFDSPEAVDRPSTKICVAARSAYDLYLSRALKSAQLVRLENGTAAEGEFLAGKCDVVAGVKQPLAQFVARWKGLRLIPGRFMAIEQAVAIPKSHASGLPTLRAFVEDAKRSGLVRRALDASGQQSAEVAPAQ